MVSDTKTENQLIVLLVLYVQFAKTKEDSILRESLHLRLKMQARAEIVDILIMSGAYPPN